MASQNSLRQASRVLQRNRLHLTSSRTCDHPSPSSLFSCRPSLRTRPIRVVSHHAGQQSRNLSLWGFGNSKTDSTTEAAATQSAQPHSNLLTAEPSDLDTTTRTVKASTTTSSAEFEPHTVNSLEPKVIEDVQQALLEPHLSDPASITPNLEDVPESIGYLDKVCGLDFGWGPSTSMEYLLETIHIAGGLSWTASILLLGITLRTVMFPFQITAAGQASKFRDLGKVMNPIQEQMKIALRDNDQMKLARLQTQLQTYRKEAGIDFKKFLYPLLIQVPFGFGAWRVLRNAATLPVPGFVKESWLWTSDLTFSDPFFIMPVISGALIYYTIRLNAQVNSRGAATAQADFMAILQRAMPVLSMAFIAFQPGAVQLYFVSSNATGLATAMLLKNEKFRVWRQLPPLPGTTDTEATAAATSGPVGPKQPAGLQTRSFIEAQARHVSEQKSHEQVGEQNQRSGIDKVVDWSKDKAGDMKSTVSGAVSKIVGDSKERLERQQKEKNVEYEARYKHRLDERRRERNRELGIEEPEKGDGPRKRR